MEVFFRPVMVCQLLVCALIFSFNRSSADEINGSNLELEPALSFTPKKTKSQNLSPGPASSGPVKDCRFDLFVDNLAAQTTDPQARFAGEGLISCLDIAGQPVELDLGVRVCPHGDQEPVSTGSATQLGVRDNPIKAMQNQKITDIYGKYALGIRREEFPKEGERIACFQKTVGDPGANLNISFLAKLLTFAPRAAAPLGRVRVYLYDLLDSVKNPSEYTCAKLEVRYFEPVRPRRQIVDEPKSVFDPREGI